MDVVETQLPTGGVFDCEAQFVQVEITRDSGDSCIVHFGDLHSKHKESNWPGGTGWGRPTANRHLVYTPLKVDQVGDHWKSKEKRQREFKWGHESKQLLMMFHLFCWNLPMSFTSFRSLLVETRVPRFEWHWTKLVNKLWQHTSLEEN